MSTFAILTPLIRLFELGTGSSGFSGLGLRVSNLFAPGFRTRRALSKIDREK